MGSYHMQDPDDWMIDAHGLYVATPSFLIRRGYCCANQCRNCPYINWRNSAAWRPLPAEKVQVQRVSSKAVEGAQKALAYHEQQQPHENQTEEALRQEMIAHYRWVLEHWETSSEKNQ